MNVEDMAYFMASQGFNMNHFWDAMELHNLPSVQEAINFLYEQKFGKNLCD